MALRRPRRGGSRKARKPASEEGSEGSEAPVPKRSERSRERAREARAGAQKAGGALRTGGAEVLAIGREMVRIPAALWMRLAERLGLFILAVVRWLRPRVIVAMRYARRGVDIAAREVTPARATAAVALAACVLLAISQFADYRDVRAGVPAYADVEQVAPPPTVDGSTRTAGSAHLYVLLLAAIAAGAVVVLSMLGRWRLARLLFPIGLAALAIAVFIDAPAGLDEGADAIQYQGAEARLLGAFWVEVSAAFVIAACGPLLAMYTRPQRARRRAAARSRRRDRDLLGRSRVQGAQP